YYNPRGKVDPASFSFPFEADSFDLVIATSVFTHLMPETVRNYIAECSRVVVPGRRFFSSFFLIENGVASADGGLVFKYPVQETALWFEAIHPERAVAYRLEWLLNLLREFDFELVEPVRWGNWTGRTPWYSGQDVLILQKKR